MLNSRFEDVNPYLYYRKNKSDIVGSYLGFVIKYVLWDDVIDWEGDLKDYGKKRE